MANKKVLFVGTSPKTRGGITSVIRIYMKMPLWNEFHIHWVGTHIDKSSALKILYAISGFFKFCYFVFQYDIIHFHISTASSAMRKYLFFKTAKLLKRKIVVHLHIGNQFDSQLKNKYAFKAYKILFDGADAIIVLSQQNKDTLNTLYNVGSKTYILYNPCPIVEDVSYTPEYKEILYAGILNHNKGYSVLLNAFAKIAPQHPDWKVNFAGNGEVSSASLMAHNLGISDQVHFLGWIKGTEKDKIFRKASILCLPSYSEGFPMAVLDAFSYALPVVATSVGGLQDVLIDGNNALLFEPGNSEQLADKLDKLMNDEFLLGKLSNASFRLANNAFNPDKINLFLSSLYNNI